MYQPWLDEGFARPGARRTRADFEITATCHLQLTEDDGPARQAVLDRLKPTVALYMGGMGAKEANFHRQVFERMGYERITDEVQKLLLAGDRERATDLLPDELVDDLPLVCPADAVKTSCANRVETREHQP